MSEAMIFMARRNMYLSWQRFEFGVQVPVVVIEGRIRCGSICVWQLGGIIPDGSCVGCVWVLWRRICHVESISFEVGDFSVIRPDHMWATSVI